MISLTQRLWVAVVVLLLGTTPGAAKVQIAQSEAPFSLTAADGTGLKLVELKANAVIDGPLAFTELKLTFENPLNRTIEGRFQVVMPDGSAISRFAMKINGAWMEGEVVEKQAARRAYEDALHRRKDPALLEQAAGNRFRARVFPIQARERKELIISWSNNLIKQGEAYRLPLKGLPSIANLQLRALTGSAKTGLAKSSLGGETTRYQVSQVSKQDFTPDQDWVISAAKIPDTGEALRQDNLVAVRFTVPSTSPDVKTPNAVIMIDTSASRAVDFANRIKGIQATVQALSKVGVEKVQVILYDQQVEKSYMGPPKGFDDAAVQSIVKRGALGASNLSMALDAMGKWSPKDSRVIFFTDGVITAGEQDRGKLKAALETIAAEGIARIDAIVDTTARDIESLKTLVQTLPTRGKVIEGRQTLEAQLTRLSQATLNDISVEIPGADWVWPQSLVGLQPGDTQVVFADIKSEVALSINLTGGITSAITPVIRAAERPLLQRAWVQARIQRLEHLRAGSDPDLKAALKQQIISISTRHRVLSSYTALVVLETEADYRRFNIPRNALADILTIGATGIEIQHRTGPVISQIATVQPRKPTKQAKKKGKKDEKVRIQGANKAIPRSRPRPATEQLQPSTRSETGAVADSDEEEIEAEIEAAPSESEGSYGSARTPVADSQEPPASPGDARSPQAKTASPRPERSNARAGGSPTMGALRGRGTGRRQRPTNRIRRRRRPAQIAGPTRTQAQGRAEFAKIKKAKPSLTGEMAKIDTLISKNKPGQALAIARAWRNANVTELLPLIGLGRALLAKGHRAQAARAFGSILDLYPSRADMRRLAGNWLDSVGKPGHVLAADTYRVAMEQRPDHPSVYHQLAMALVQLGKHGDAFNVLERGLTARRANNRFQGVERILREDIELVASAWLAQDTRVRAVIETKLNQLGLRLSTKPSLRFVLTWETDANDVDFHIFDKGYGHAFYRRKQLRSGGELYADITTGYGPECFTIFNAKNYPYRLKAHYYRRGPMGYGAGKLQIIRHDGKGRITMTERPFVIMQDGAFVDLGKVTTRTARMAR